MLGDREDCPDADGARALEGEDKTAWEVLDGESLSEGSERPLEGVVVFLDPED